MAEVFSMSVGLKETGAATVKAAIDKLKASMKDAGKEATAMDSAVDGLSKQLKAFAMQAAATLGVRELIRMADGYATMTARLQLTTDSAAELAMVQAQLLKIAQDQRVPLEAVADLYGRIALSADDLGFSQQEMLHFTKQVSQALTISGTSAGQAAGALMQLGQALGGGTVRAEEFNSILEGTPRLARAAAESLGMTVSQLRNAVIAGEMSSQVFARAILDNTKLSDEFAKMPTTIGGAFTQLMNQLTVAVGEMSKVTGAAEGIVTVLGAVGRIVTTVTREISGLVVMVKGAYAEFTGFFRILRGMEHGAIYPEIYRGVTDDIRALRLEAERLKKPIQDIGTTSQQGADFIAKMSGSAIQTAGAFGSMADDMFKAAPKAREFVRFAKDAPKQMAEDSAELKAEWAKLLTWWEGEQEKLRTKQVQEQARRMAGAPATSAATGFVPGMIGSVSANIVAQVQAGVQTAKAAADLAILQSADAFRAFIAESFASAIAQGLQQAFAVGLASRSISAGFAALAATMISGLGSMMVQFGTKALAAALAISKLWKFISAPGPLGVAAALGIIAIGASLQAAGGAIFNNTSGRGGGGAGAVGGSYMATAPGAGGTTLPGLTFGPTMASSASSVSAMAPVAVTIIGPNDPQAQRQMQELIRNANRRGNIMGA